MLRAYKALTAEDFADDKTDADTGLDKPATLAFTLKDNGGAPEDQRRQDVDRDPAATRRKTGHPRSSS